MFDFDIFLRFSNPWMFSILNERKKYVWSGSKVVWKRDQNFQNVFPGFRRMGWGIKLWLDSKLEKPSPQKNVLQIWLCWRRFSCRKLLFLFTDLRNFFKFKKWMIPVYNKNIFCFLRIKKWQDFNFRKSSYFLLAKVKRDNFWSQKNFF